LGYLGRSWGVSDERTADLASRQAKLFNQVAPETQTALLRGLASWFTGAGGEKPSMELLSACAQFLSDAGPTTDVNTQMAALELAVLLSRQPVECTELLQPMRALAAAGLRSSSPENRLRAVQLSLRPGVDLLNKVEGLLRDPSVEVRRAAILAVGPAERIVRDESLLPGLHDSDMEVRTLTERALRARGLRPEHLLAQASDLDPGVWLRRLSHDNSPAVRAAAVRVMSRMSLIDLTDRIDQMARSDPSPTVAQLARYYLGQRHHERRQQERTER
jgi:hypothetical protein